MAKKFFDGFEGLALSGEIERLEIYGVNMTRKMLRVMGISNEELRQVESGLGPEYGLTDFCEQMAFPILLFPRKVKAFPFQLFFTKFSKTPAFLELAEVLEIIDPDRDVGIIFSAWRKHWILHTYWNIPEDAGSSRLKHYGVTEGVGVVLDTVDSFAKSIKPVWSYD